MERLITNWLEKYKRYKGMVVDYLRNRMEYFNDNSTLKVFGHVTTLSRIPLFKRAFWTFTLLASFYAAATVLKGALDIYSADAVTFSVETDYLHWDTPFPGVTVCEQPDSTLIKKKLAKVNLSGLSLFAKQIWANFGCRMCKTCKPSMCTNDVEELLETIRTPCEELFAECWWNNEKQPCCQLFKPLNTSFGTCYAFNSQFDNDEPLKHINRIIGLPALVITSNVEILVKTHSPGEIISSVNSEVQDVTKSLCTTLQKGFYFEIVVRVEQTYSDTSVKTIPKHKRECLLEDEQPDFTVIWPFKKYSYYACLWYCQALDQYRACNCTSYFMPKIDMGEGIVPVCDLTGLSCINKYKEEFGAACQCPMNCNEVSVEVTRDLCEKNKEKSGNLGKAVIKVGQLPSLRIRRHAIRDMLGLVVDFGGVIGVFFGASLLSFIEIVYIFCMRRNM